MITPLHHHVIKFISVMPVWSNPSFTIIQAPVLILFKKYFYLNSKSTKLRLHEIVLFCKTIKIGPRENQWNNSIQKMNLFILRVEASKNCHTSRHCIIVLFVEMMTWFAQPLKTPLGTILLEKFLNLIKSVKKTPSNSDYLEL